VLPEYFPYQPFGTVADNRTAEFLGRGNPEPRLAVHSRQDEHRHQPAMQPRARLVHLLELGASADMPAGAKAVIHGTGGTEPKLRRGYRGDDTLRRFRPFARRRFSTMRPFFVLMRTRNPWVRRRRRLFG
jgi:hypothetical protein